MNKFVKYALVLSAGVCSSASFAGVITAPLSPTSVIDYAGDFFQSALYAVKSPALTNCNVGTSPDMANTAYIPLVLPNGNGLNEAPIARLHQAQMMQNALNAARARITATSASSPPPARVRIAYDNTDPQNCKLTGIFIVQ